jgi:hypothetical protein
MRRDRRLLWAVRYRSATVRTKVFGGSIPGYTASEDVS